MIKHNCTEVRVEKKKYKNTKKLKKKKKKKKKRQESIFQYALMEE